MSISALTAMSNPAPAGTTAAAPSGLGAGRSAAGRIGRNLFDAVEISLSMLGSSAATTSTASSGLALAVFVEALLAAMHTQLRTADGLQIGLRGLVHALAADPSGPAAAGGALASSFGHLVASVGSTASLGAFLHTLAGQVPAAGGMVGAAVSAKA